MLLHPNLFLLELIGVDGAANLCSGVPGGKAAMFSPYSALWMLFSERDDGGIELLTVFFVPAPCGEGENAG
jgi:hypothetical protein